MDKKRQIILFSFLALISLSCYSQFNTIKKHPKQYVIIKQEELKNEYDNIPQQQGKKLFVDSLTNNTTNNSVDTVFTQEKNKLIKKVLKGLHLPLKKLFVTSHFGYRKDPFTGRKKLHRGTDFRSRSDSVFSIIPGIIKNIGYDKKGLGNFVEIKNGDFNIIYGHLKTSIGTKGDYVTAGDVIGISGNTGRSTGEHLHLTIKYKGNLINPLPLIKFIESYSDSD